MMRGGGGGHRRGRAPLVRDRVVAAAGGVTAAGTGSSDAPGRYGSSRPSALPALPAYRQTTSTSFARVAATYSSRSDSASRYSSSSAARRSQSAGTAIGFGFQPQSGLISK